MGELLDRINATAGPNPPPSRRYRLVLDLHADTLNDLVQAMSEVAGDVWDHYHRETRPAMRTTHGGSRCGWHVETVDAGPDVTSRSYADDLYDWVHGPGHGEGERP